MRGLGGRRDRVRLRSRRLGGASHLVTIMS
jgi:hypothetical protein